MIRREFCMGVHELMIVHNIFLPSVSLNVS